MAQGEAPNAPDQLILLGDVEYKISVEETNIPTNDNFTQVKLSGDKSVYVLYDVTDLSSGVTPDKIQVVTSTTPVPLNFTPRSAKGNSKSGLILFETFNYGGRSQCYVSDSGDVTDKFPLGTSGGEEECLPSWSMKECGSSSRELTKVVAPSSLMAVTSFHLVL